MSIAPDEPPCECPGPGLCPRYVIRQGVHEHGLCQRSPQYRKLWADRRDGKRSTPKSVPVKPGPVPLPTVPPPARADATPAPAGRFAALRRCVHAGPKLPGEPCGSTLRTCTRHGVTCSGLRACDEAPRNHGTCPDYQPAQPAAPGPPPVPGP